MSHLQHKDSFAVGTSTFVMPSLTLSVSDDSDYATTCTCQLFSTTGHYVTSVTGKVVCLGVRDMCNNSIVQLPQSIDSK